MRKLTLLIAIFCSFNALAQTPWISFRSHSGHESGFSNAAMEDNLGMPVHPTFKNYEPVIVNDTSQKNSIKKDSIEIKKQEELQKNKKAGDVKKNEAPVNVSGGPSEGKKSKKKRMKKSTASSTKILNHTTVNHKKELKQNGFSAGIFIAGVVFLLVGLVVRKISLVNK